MSEDSSNLLAADSPSAFDLRRVGANPDYWYPLAWSDELKVGRTLGRRFAGQPIVLFRGTGGQVFALEDRCAHRQIPLHLGVVKGNELKCHYHGWTYNGAGRCVNVPYLGVDRLPTLSVGTSFGAVRNVLRVSSPDANSETSKAGRNDRSDFGAVEDDLRRPRAGVRPPDGFGMASGDVPRTPGASDHNRRGLRSGQLVGRRQAAIWADNAMERRRRAVMLRRATFALQAPGTASLTSWPD